MDADISIKSDAPLVTQQFQEGVSTFSRLFAHWMDQNGWSHPVMTSLARSALGGVGWLHSSQLSGLRHGRLKSPGPRTFVAIERLNYYLHRYATRKLLIPGTSSSNHYASPYLILEKGEPPSLGWWVEVFCGVRVPENADYINGSRFTDNQAEKLSDAYGRYVRHLVALARVDIVTEIGSILRDHYPIPDPYRRDKLRNVIMATETWTGDEFSAELPYLTQLTKAFGGSDEPDQLLEELQ